MVYTEIWDKMKVGKIGGPSRVLTEMLKASDNVGVFGKTESFSLNVSGGHIPEDWKIFRITDTGMPRKRIGLFLVHIEL